MRWRGVLDESRKASKVRRRASGTDANIVTAVRPFVMHTLGMTEATVLWATGLMSVAAIIAAPIITLWIQRKLEVSKARTERRQAIFRALWVNRRRQFYVARVDALNMIEVEFFDEKTVWDAWDDLRAHYFRQEHPGLNEDQIFAEREEKFASLLFAISQVLGYGFGRTHIRDAVYRPQLHGRFDEIEFETRTRVLDLLKSDALPVRFVEGPPAPPKVQEPPQERRGAPDATTL